MSTDHLSDDAIQAIRETDAALRTALARMNLGDYGLLIGEDTSGRIPALIMRSIMNNARAARGQPVLPVVFMQSAWASELSESQRDRMTQAWARRRGNCTQWSPPGAGLSW